MLYGWVKKITERIDDTDGDAFKDGDYYFGGEDDVMTTGWLLMDITYDEATNDNEIAPAFMKMKIRAAGSTSSPMVRRFTFQHR